jgi:hypothetical protein
MTGSPTRSESFSDLGSDNDIEMTTLEDVVMSPGVSLPHQYSTRGESSDDESDTEDGVGRALLNPSSERAQPFEHDKRSHSRQSQLIHLVVEVGSIAFCSSSH